MKGRRIVKGRTREREDVCSNVRASERNTRERELRRRRAEEKERKEDAEEEIPVPTEWESNTFLAVPRFRSAPDPPSPPPPYLPATPSYTFSTAPFSYALSDLSKVSSARLPSRRPYAKCIYVLCKASNRRWPREPDAQCVINTDALVVPFPPSSLLRFPSLIRLLRACPVSARSSRANETHRSFQ